MKSYRILWSLWFTTLTLVSIGLLILVIVLMEDRKSLKAKEAEGAAFIKDIEALLELESEKVAAAKWAAMTNQTEPSRQNYHYVLYNYDKLVREVKLNMSTIPWESYKNGRLRRKFFLFLRSPRISLLAPWETAKLNEIKANITTNQIKLEFKAVKAAADSIPSPLSRNLSEFERIKIAKWMVFNDRIGEGAKSQFQSYVELMNENAVLSGYSNAADYWLISDYEMESRAVRKIVYKLWDQVKPLYQQLHAYVLHELGLQGFVPVHLTETEERAEGSWANLFQRVKPFPNRPELNITAEIWKQKYSPDVMAKLTEDFFQSNNFPAMDAEFWSKSLFTNSIKTKMDCRPTFYKISNNEKELRISMCGQRDENTLRTINKLMTRAKFAMLRKDQPFLFRYEPNSVTAMAAEEAVQMFMTSSNSLRSLGLMPDVDDDEPRIIQTLFREALDLLPRLAHSLAFDQWNAYVFGEVIKPRDYNCKWWYIRQNREGVEPPPPLRRKGFQFDPARSSYLVSPPSAPLQYFVSSIMKFQLYRSLAQVAADDNSYLKSKNRYELDSASIETHPPIDSSLSLSGKAGELLSSLLKIGGSKPWQTALNQVSNEKELRAEPLLEYFEPLARFLKEQNEIHGLELNWKQKINKSRLICSLK